MARTIKDGQIVRAMERFNGKISEVARFLGVTPSAIYNRLQRSPKLQHRFEFFQESLLDAAIDRARDLIEQGDRAVILHVLKTLGHKRGLSERLVIEGGDKPIGVETTETHVVQHQYDFSKLPIEARKLLLAAMRKESAGDPTAFLPASVSEDPGGIEVEEDLANEAIDVTPIKPINPKKPHVPASGLIEL